jgi:hypothetical protein
MRDKRVGQWMSIDTASGENPPDELRRSDTISARTAGAGITIKKGYTWTFKASWHNLDRKLAVSSTQLQLLWD